MNRKMAVWFAVTLASFAVGAIIGYVLMLFWFVICVFFLGYGDSGPSWVNTVSDDVLFVGVILGVVGGQLAFFLKMGKHSSSPAAEPR
jgi:hypothetical protein